MDFSLTEEQQALGDLARDILSDRCTHERLKELEAQAPYAVFDRELWRRLADAGIVGAVVPAEHGGAGLGLGALLGVLEAAGAHVAPVPLVPTAVGARAIARHGTAEQRDALLPGVSSGDIVLALGLEEAANDDLLAPVTDATPDGDVWRVSGEKALVAYGREAHRIVVSVHGPDGPSLGLVDPAAGGTTLTDERATNRQPHATLTLDEAPVTPLATGVADLQRVLQEAAAATCVVQAGVCDGALKMTAEHASNREQFGKPIAEFQAVAQRAAEAFIDTEMVRLTAWQALDALDRGDDATVHVHTAKFWAGDGAMRVVHAAQHLHGGLGVDLDYPLHRYFVWAKQLEHTLGTPTRELIRLGTALAVEPT